MLSVFIDEYARYRAIAEKALAQVTEEGLNHVPVVDGNSIAMLVRHLTGNLKSRFTDFLTTDGEKPWRNRDGEFEERIYTREALNQMWNEAWDLMDRELGQLSDSDLGRKVLIRGQEWTVAGALARSVAHLAYHVGQIVLLARMAEGDDWDWISIPKGDSATYNQNPVKDRGL